MRYSLSFKETQVKKLLPPNEKTFSEVANESGVADQTLRNWLNKAKEGTLAQGNTVSGTGRSPREKLSLVIESKTVSDEDHGRWLE